MNEPSGSLDSTFSAASLDSGPQYQPYCGRERQGETDINGISLRIRPAAAYVFDFLNARGELQSTWLLCTLSILLDILRFRVGGIVGIGYT